MFGMIFIIFLFVVLLSYFVFLIRERRIFPQLFWGIVLGIGVLCLESLVLRNLTGYKVHSTLNFLNRVVPIRETFFIGPIFGIFAGIVIGASSKPFAIKKLASCICAGVISGIIYSIYLFFSETDKPRYIPFIDVPKLIGFSFMLTPIVIGIADKSFSKAIGGIIAGGCAIFFYMLSTVFAWSFAGCLACFLNPHASRGWGMAGLVELHGWESWPIYVAKIVACIVIVIGIEIKEVFPDLLAGGISGIVKEIFPEAKKKEENKQ